MKDLSKIENYILVIDMVNGFVKEGNMHDKEIANIISAQIDLLERYQGDNCIIGIVKDTHDDQCVEFSSYPKHCVKGTGEENLVDELARFENENSLVYEKNSTSIAHVPSFFADIKKMPNLKKVVVIGCCTDICVLQAAIPLKTYFNEMNLQVEVTVPKNAVETYNAPTHDRKEYNEIAFKLMENAGIRVVEEV